jgi:hypothetical protein
LGGLYSEQTLLGVPSAVINVHDSVQVDVSGFTYCFRNAGAELWCWGAMEFETCDPGFMYAPPTLTPFSNVSGFAAGFDVCAISGAQLKCQGKSFCGGLDGGVPMVWSGLSGVASVRTGDASCAVLSTGVVECWGDNTNGMLGDGTTSSRSNPAPVSGISDAVGVAVGAVHVCAWLKDGSATCWGYNMENALGAGLPTNALQLVPVKVPGLAGVVQMAAGCFFTCAVLKDGSVWCWGDPLYAGQDGLVSTTSVAMPMRVEL